MSAASKRLLFALLVAISITVNAYTAPPRIAIVASGGKRAEGIVELMQVKLSMSDDYILIERAQISKVLVEHKLSSQGRMSAGNTIKLAQLLKCDVFVEYYAKYSWTKRKSTQYLSAFDARTGLTICNSFLESDEDIERAAVIAKTALMKSLSQYYESKTKKTAISIKSIRDINLGDEHKNIVDSFPMFFKQQVLNHPEIAILERERLAAVIENRYLTLSDDDNILTSSYLLDIDLQKSVEGQTLTVTLQIGRAGEKGKVTVKSSGSIGDIQPVAIDLANKLGEKLKLLKSTQKPSVDHLAEAKLFASEADLRDLYSKGTASGAPESSLNAAIVLSEKAVEEDPDNYEAKNYLAGYLLDSCFRHIARQDYDKAIELLLRNIELKSELAQKTKKSIEQQKTIVTSGYYGMHVADLRLKSEFSTRTDDMSDESKHIYTLARNELKKYFILKESQSLDYDRPNSHHEEWLIDTPEEWLVYVSSSSTYPVYLDINKWASQFSKEQRTQFLSILERWTKSVGTDRNCTINMTCRQMMSYIWLAAMAQRYPDDYTDPEKVINSNLDKAFSMILNNAGNPRDWERHFGNTKFPPELFAERLWLKFKSAYENKHKKKPDFSDSYFHWIDWIDRHYKVNDSTFTEHIELARNKSRGRHNKGINNMYVRRTGKPRAEYKEKVEKQPEAIATWISKTKIYNVPPINMEEFRFEHPGYEKKYMDKIDLSILCARKKENVIYILRRRYIPHVESWTYLTSIDLTTGASKEHSRLNNRVNPSFDAANMRIGNKGCWLPFGNGIYFFPFDKGEVTMLTKKEGLPFGGVWSCLEVDGVLYLGGSDRNSGYLLRIDANSSEVKNLKLLACGSRTEKRSELDNSGPYTIGALFCNQSSDKIMFSANFEKTSRNFEMYPDGPPSGLWELRSHSDKLIRLSNTRGGYLSLDGYRHLAGPRLTDKGWLFRGNLPNQSIYYYYYWTPESSKLARINNNHRKSAMTKAGTVEGTLPINNVFFQYVHDKEWRLLDKFGGTSSVIPLVLLEDLAPFALWKIDNNMLACTKKSLWLLEPAISTVDMSKNDMKNIVGTWVIYYPDSKGKMTIKDDGTVAWGKGNGTWKMEVDHILVTRSNGKTFEIPRPISSSSARYGNYKITKQ